MIRDLRRYNKRISDRTLPMKPYNEEIVPKPYPFNNLYEKDDFVKTFRKDYKDKGLSYNNTLKMCNNKDIINYIRHISYNTSPKNQQQISYLKEGSKGIQYKELARENFDRIRGYDDFCSICKRKNLRILTEDSFADIIIDIWDENICNNTV